MLLHIKRYREKEFIDAMEELGVDFEIDYQSLDRGSYDVMIDDNNPVKDEILLRLEEWQS